MRGSLVAGLGLASGGAVLAALHVWRGFDSWNFSEGVYALTSLMLLHGADLYGHVVAAQPPALFLTGAGMLAVHDSLGWLRLAVGAVQLAGGLVGAAVSWRLTQSAAAAAAAPALALLLPWAVHEHGTLSPEPFAALLLLGGAVLAARRRTAAWGGAVAAVCVGFKLPFLIPLVCLVTAAADRRRAALGAGLVLVVGAVASFVVFGDGVWHDTVEAQAATGHRGLHDLLGYWAQAAWSLAGLVALAGVAWQRRRDLRDRPLQGTVTAVAVGSLLTLLTNWKTGTGLNIIVPVEATLLPLSLAGAVILFSGTTSRAGALAAAAALLFVFAQSASLLLHPRTEPPFLYPTSERGAWGRAVTGDAIRDLVRRARSCPPGAKYTGVPLIAFIAHRPVPDAQPDLFLATRSSRLRDVALAMAADRPRCP